MVQSETPPGTASPRGHWGVPPAWRRIGPSWRRPRKRLREPARAKIPTSAPKAPIPGLRWRPLPRNSWRGQPLAPGGSGPIVGAERGQYVPGWGVTSATSSWCHHHDGHIPIARPDAGVRGSGSCWGTRPHGLGMVTTPEAVKSHRSPASDPVALGTGQRGGSPAGGLMSHRATAGTVPAPAAVPGPHWVPGSAPGDIAGPGKAPRCGQRPELPGFACW